MGVTMKTTKAKMMEKTVTKVSELIQAKDGYAFMEHLLARWEDEKEYEDFEDYKSAIRKNLSYLKITSVTKRPFGIVFNHKKIVIRLKYLKRGNGYSRQLQWRAQ
jgi:hypothetical protein